MNENLYLDIFSQNDLFTIKIGILQESSHLPYSETVKRAIESTEAAVKQLGFNIVPFFLTQDVWDSARDFIQSMRANFHEKELRQIMKDSCEPVVEELQK